MKTTLLIGSAALLLACSSSVTTESKNDTTTSTSSTTTAVTTNGYGTGGAGGSSTTTGYGGCFYGSGTSSYGSGCYDGSGGYQDVVVSSTSVGGDGGAPPVGCQGIPTPAPVGAITCDGGSAGSGMGPIACEIDCHDENGNGFETFCQGNLCQCQYNFQTYCECENVEPACGGGKTCCPPPWLAP